MHVHSSILFKRSLSFYFDGCLDGLHLHCDRFPDAELMHIDQLSCFAIDTPAEIFALLTVLGTQCRQLFDNVATAILNQRTRNYFKSTAHCFVRIFLNAFEEFIVVRAFAIAHGFQRSTVDVCIRIPSDNSIDDLTVKAPSLQHHHLVSNVVPT
jgi:hypothetical protein